MNDIVSELGNKIRILRTNLSISQEELAFKSGISPAHLGQIERGLKSPTITTVKKIADALNVSLADLFTFNNLITSKSNTELNKITSFLNGFSDNDLKDIYKILKSIVNYKNKP